MSNQEKFWQRQTKSFKLFDSKDDPIYKYVCFDTAIKIINSNSLMYSPPALFNDPFDMTTSFFNFNLDDNDIMDLLADFGNQNSKKQEIINYYKKSPEELSKLMIEILDDHKQKIGATCFSTSNSIPLMWSHYSNKHSGICLGFAFEEYDDGNFIQAPITYIEKLEKIHYVKNTRQALNDWMFCKSHVWKYEEEVRRISLNKTGLMPFLKSELCEVLYGLNITIDQIDFFENLISKNKYQIKKRQKIILNEENFDLKAIDFNIS